MFLKRILLTGTTVGVLFFSTQPFCQEMTEMQKSELQTMTIPAGPKLSMTYPSFDQWVETKTTPTKRVPIDTEKWGALYKPTYAIKTTGKTKTEKIHRMERTGSSRIRIAACTDPGAKAFINGKEVKVYSTGAFVGMVDLVPGENKIELIAEDSSGKTVKSFLVERSQPLKSSPEIPLTIESTQMISPNDALVLQPGEELVVRFKGSPGGKASFSFGESKKEYPMRELDIASTGSMAGVGGIYVGSYIIQPSDNFKDNKIKFKLAKEYEGTLHTTTHTAPGEITVDTSPIPTVARLTTDYKTVYTDADGYTKLFPLTAEGIKLQLVGRKGNMLKVRLSPNEVGWIDPDDVEILPAGTPIPTATVNSISLSTSGRWSRIFISMSERLPYRIDQYLNPSVLELTIYGGISRLSWITENMDDPIIQSLQWKQIGEKTLKLRVDLKNEQQWGWNIKYEGTAMVFEIKQPAKLAKPPASPVAGLKFVIDSGHGGRELGAVGAAGIREKDVNLGYVTELANLFRAAGATVVLTHSGMRDDSAMRISERMKVAIAEQADIYLVCHNNSVGGTGDPIVVRGTSAYYHQPQGLALGHSIYRRLLDELGYPGFGFVYFDAAAVRTHQAITALVEGLFMSHPEEEAALNTPEFQKKLATAIFHGVEDFLVSIVE
ncbi:MAG: N-acetylmuramoyl-L-alanine amidase, partial [bacterium]|nr:N-acetylmuramoyl-L-alanine amidase [bacterium]